MHEYRKGHGMQIVCFSLSVFSVAAMAVASFAAVASAKTEKNISELKQDIQKERDPRLRFYLLSDLVSKYASGKITMVIVEDVGKSAESLLKESGNFKRDWNYGNAIHHSHLVLGRLNLLSGKMDDAKRELKLAGETKGSPQLDSFGPNMTLAKELLEKGEKSAVLEYFDSCLKFWKSPAAQETVDHWKADIERGRIPEFSGHLNY